MLGDRSGVSEKIAAGMATAAGLIGLLFGLLGVRFAKDPALNPSA